jgi:hypothetical protein
MRTRTLRIALVIGALIVAGACDEGSPTAPDSTPAITSLTISGNTSINPGATTRLTATAAYSDSTTQDVTAEALWSSMTEVPGVVGVFTLISPGVIRGNVHGWGTIRAEYGRKSATAPVRVAPEGVFLLTVTVSDHGYATDAARLSLTSPAGTFSATTNVWGVAFLPATGSATLQIEKQGFRTTTRSVTVSTDQTVDVVLQPSDVA